MMFYVNNKMVNGILKPDKNIPAVNTFSTASPSLFAY